jgi:hypothetical protein
MASERGAVSLSAPLSDSVRVPAAETLGGRCFLRFASHFFRMPMICSSVYQPLLTFRLLGSHSRISPRPDSLAREGVARVRKGYDEYSKRWALFAGGRADGLLLG